MNEKQIAEIIDPDSHTISVFDQPAQQHDYWQEEARRYAQNADFWRGKYEAATAQQQEPKDPLKEAVYEFFTKYLNRVEYSDSDRPFNPITIGCCRVMMLKPLGDLLDKMRELSGAGPNPLEKTTK